MTQRGPWSVKGIDSRAREAAREAAREEGMTLGAYLNRLILEEGLPEASGAGPARPNENSGQQTQYKRTATSAAQNNNEPSATSLDRLTRRIESAEARSTLAITGIDQSVVGLLSRLENAEHNQEAMGSHFTGLMDDIQRTYEALDLKVKQVENDDSSASNLRALKALEDALGKLASHVYAENELVGEETGAIKARLESGFDDLNDRMASIDSQIEEKLEDATSAFTKAVQDAELRTEGASRHLAERFSAVELDVADKLSHVSNMSEAMDTVHSGVKESMSEMGDTLGKVHERLSHAETQTDQAMKRLEERLGALDSRLADVANYANEDTDKAMRQQFEERFESLSADLRQLVASTRAELAAEIETATKSVDTEILAKLNGAIGTINTRLESSEDMHAQTMDMVSDTVSRITDSVDQRLTANQEQQARAIDQVSEQVTRIAGGLDKRLEHVASEAGNLETNALREEMIRFTNTLDERLEYLETREDATFEKVSTEVGKLASRLDERVLESENRSASAIQQVGEQVTTVTSRLEQRQAEALKAFASKIDSTQKRQDARLSGALNNVSDRLERMQEQSLKSMSPVQKAIAALAQRLEAIEEFSAPPYAERGNSPTIPDMVAPNMIDTSIVPAETAETAAEQAEADEKLESYLNPIFSNEPDENIAAPTAHAGNDLDAKFEAADLIASDLEAAMTPKPEETLPSEDTFEPGYQNWADDANAVLDDTLGIDDMPDLGVADIETPVAAAPPPIDDTLWNDGVSETRDTDIFDEPPAPSDFPDVNDSIHAFEDIATDTIETGEPYRDDYISQARRAAKDAAAGVAGSTGKPSKKKSMNVESNGIDPKRAGIAALAAVAVVGTVGGVMYMRGQNQAPAVNFDANTNATAPTTIADASALTPAEDALASPASTPASVDTQILEQEAIDAPAPTGETQLASLAAGAGESTAVEPTLIPDPQPVTSTAPAPLPSPTTFNAPRIPTGLSLGQAALDGNRIAQYQSGLADLRGGSFATGADWLKKAANQGLPVAQYELALLHENGTGTTRDFAEARRLHGVAARGGHVEAMFDFATYNANGEAGPANAQVAAEWFRKAAEFGHADSQYNLAQLYISGTGVSPSMTEALFWFELAARSGDLDARQSADDLVAIGNVSEQAARQVRQRAGIWRPSRATPLANGQFSAQPWERATGNQTLAVQQVLLALGYSAGTADGIIGGQTVAAIKDFERAAGLPVTGQISNNLVDALNAAADEKRKDI